MHYAAFRSKHWRKAEGASLTHSTTGGTVGHPLDGLNATLPVALGIDDEPLYKRAIFINSDVQQVLYGIDSLTFLADKKARLLRSHIYDYRISHVMCVHRSIQPH